MNMTGKSMRRVFASALVASAIFASAGCAQATGDFLPYVKGALVQVDVYDRNDGQALPLHTQDARHYIVGTPGHEYGVRIRNCTDARVLVVTSVDGVNVISGDTAAPSQSGYVLEPWGSVEIAGWRKSMERTAAFYFTDLGDSYAARTGRPDNVGVVGVAVFQEKHVSTTLRDMNRYRPGAKNEADDGAPAAPQPSAMPAPAPAATVRQESAAATGSVDVPADGRSSAESKKGFAEKSLGKLGTGHGRNENSRVTLTSFERASSSPAEIIAIQYDRRENLVAMGVLPAPRLARRDLQPFPGILQFAPDPRR